MRCFLSKKRRVLADEAVLCYLLIIRAFYFSSVHLLLAHALHRLLILSRGAARIFNLPHSLPSVSLLYGTRYGDFSAKAGALLASCYFMRIILIVGIPFFARLQQRVRECTSDDN